MQFEIHDISSPCRDEGAYPLRSFNKRVSKRRAQLSVASHSQKSATF